MELSSLNNVLSPLAMDAKPWPWLRPLQGSCVLIADLVKVEEFLITLLPHFISKPCWHLPVILGLMCSGNVFLRANVVSSMGFFLLQGTSLLGLLGPRIASGQFLVCKVISVAS